MLRYHAIKMFISLFPVTVCSLVFSPPACGQGESLLLQGLSPYIGFYDTDGTLQEWELSGTDSGFELFNISTNTRSLAITTDAPDNSFVVNSRGAGFGIFNPDWPLHVFRDVPNGQRIALFDQKRPNKLNTLAVYNSAASSNLNTTGYEFLLDDSVGMMTAARIICSLPVTNRANATSALLFQTRNDGDFATAMRFEANRVSIGTNASTHLLRVLNATCNGTTWADASSRTLKQDIAPLSVDAARAAVMALEPVSYAYQQDPTDPRLGFIAEDVPEAVAMPDRQSLSSLDIVAALTRVVQEQEREIEGLQARLQRQEAAIESLQQALEPRDSPPRK